MCAYVHVGGCVLTCGWLHARVSKDAKYSFLSTSGGYTVYNVVNVCVGPHILGDGGLYGECVR